MSITLYTPEEAAARIRVITASEIRRLIRDREIEYTSLARGKHALTEEQMRQMLEHLAVKPREGAQPGTGSPATPIGATARSARARQARSLNRPSVFGET